MGRAGPVCCQSQGTGSAAHWEGFALAPCFHPSVCPALTKSTKRGNAVGAVSLGDNEFSGAQTLGQSLITIIVVFFTANSVIFESNVCTTQSSGEREPKLLAQGLCC